MKALSLHQALTLYTWFPLAGLLFFLLLIARFYQKFSGERTYFRLFLLPVVLFGVAVVRFASVDRMVDDWPGNLALALAGLLLVGLSVTLVLRMTAHRRRLRGGA